MDFSAATLEQSEYLTTLAQQFHIAAASPEVSPQTAPLLMPCHAEVERQAAFIAGRSVVFLTSILPASEQVTLLPPNICLQP